MIGWLAGASFLMAFAALFFALEAYRRVRNLEAGTPGDVAAEEHKEPDLLWDDPEWIAAARKKAGWR